MIIELEGTNNEFKEFLKYIKSVTQEVRGEWESVFIQLEEKITKMPDMEGISPLDKFFESDTHYPSTVPPSDETKHKVTYSYDARSIQEIQSDHKKWLKEHQDKLKGKSFGEVLDNLDEHLHKVVTNRRKTNG